MYRRLVTFALLVVTVSVTALAIPLALAARDLVRAGNLTALSDQARVLADGWEALARRSSPAAAAERGEDAGSEDRVGSGSGSDGGSGSGSGSGSGEGPVQVPVVDVSGTATRVVLVTPDGRVVGGPVPAGGDALVADALDGRSTSRDTGPLGLAAAPAVFADEAVGAVLAVADEAQMTRGLKPRLAVVAGLCALLLAGAGCAAWLLARRTAAPIRELAATADALAAGDLDARARPTAISEVDDVGVALNRLSGRVQELLDEERAAAAELAHQLRTPLTVLAADVDAVTDPELRQRLSEDVLTLQRTTDEIINSARRTSREGLHAACDAAAVVADRAAFWLVLAEFQGRAMTVGGCEAGPLPVRLTEADLATAVDILLQNVFTHTEEGVGLELTVARAADGLVEVSVRDHGAGFGAEPGVGARAGSTGLGLAIAGRLAAASGGQIVRASAAGGGALVTLRLGPATD